MAVAFKTPSPGRGLKPSQRRSRPSGSENLGGQKRVFGGALSSLPARFAIVVFTIMLFVWATLLALPISSASGEFTPVPDALFTAVSTICVTGLATVDMANHWSVFGQVIILIGAQIGGIGVLSFSAILGLTVTRKLGLKQRIMAQSDTNGTLRSENSADAPRGRGFNLGDTKGLLISIVISTLLIELLIMVLLYPHMLAAGYDPLHSLWYSGYLAITCFTNTGFVPMREGLEPFATNGLMLGTMAFGVILGGLGFPVIFSLWRFLHKKGWRTHGRIGLHAKLTLTTTVILILLGWVLVAVFEANNDATLGGKGFWWIVLHSFYTSVMTRTGGFSVVDVGEMHESTFMLLDMLMFVGGGSASTAGGIKVTTLAVLFLAAWAEARGYKDVQAFGRRIPSASLRVAISVVIWGATLVVASTMAIAITSGEPLGRVLFEVISGFSTCGLSNGLSGELSDAGKIILTVTIWAGRLGTVTIASAVAASSRSRMYSFPEERPIVG